MSARNLIIAIVLGSALAAGIFVAARMNQPAALQHAFAVPIPQPLPAFTLIDQNGNAVTADTFRGQWDLVFFGFTNCPDICPTTLQILANAKRAFISAKIEVTPRIVLVSVDPERDTPEIMGKYVDYFGDGNLGVSGELAELTKFTAALGIYFEKMPAEGENYSVNHSAAVLVINPQGEFSALFSAPHDVSNYIHDLPILMGAD
ncbi:MAG: SCO family protein [Gammaproteobacteria bacterium]|jgi:protein SCO1/2|nr:SCO family protein [Gammaproteobacteria bacterium]MDH5242177.1 SCO family protein [Gammaproteobacteria bacterium]MDH5262747.1 SCO family protein [Gammaproteobacteria bacterium]MDH5583814.1 SCO family protein [Gammaproteobacteria bacterium]